MAIKIDKSKMSDTPWGEVDKSAMGKALATAYAAGNVTKAQIREVYAFIPEDAFGKDSDGKPVGSPTGKPTFAYTKAFGPHHEMKGDSIVLNRGGLGGAAGAVAGSRSPSGPSLSSGDLAKAKAHLRRHYKAMKMEMPAGMKEALEVRRAERGSPLTEMVKGSLQYMGAMIEDAFREQFKQPDFRYDYHGSSMWCPFYIVDTFADHVVVSELGSMDDCELAPDEYYLVTYTRDADGKIVFAPREEWEIVELAYQPQTQNATPMGAGESLKPPALPQAGTTAPGDPPTTPGGPPRSGHGQVGTPGVATGARRGARMEERVKTSVELLESSEDGKTRKIRVNGLMTAGVVNGNGRRYPQGVVEAAVAEWRTHLHESAGQGRLKILTGEADHPRDKGKKRPEFLETVVKWTNLAMDGPRLDVEGELILTSKGKDVEALMEAGVMPGGSVRGYYEAHEVKEGGRKVEEVEWCEITGADLVGDPSFDNVADLLESQQRQRIGDKTQQRIGDATKGDDKMDPEEIRKFIAENPQMFEGLIKGKVDEAVKAMSADQLKALEEAVKKAQGEADKAVAELEGRKKAEVVEKAIAEATKELPYGDMNEVFVGAVRQEAQRFAQSDKPDEAVKAFVEAKRKEYDAMAAKSKLAAMGMTGIKVIGPVIESETDTPEYAKGSQEFYESLVNAGHIQRRELRKSERINDIAALKMLRRFDAAYRPQLMRESKLMDEAELSTDLNVPYTVSRAILQAAWPQLVATSIFDFDTIDLPLAYVYYEEYSAESGSTGTETVDTTTMTALDTWYDLDNKMVQPGTVVATDTTPTPDLTLVEGTDFVVDYMDGKIKALTGGQVTAGDVISCAYTYDQIRQGENVAIERGKLVLNRATLTATADRLAQEITNEAVVFSRSQLGWDATTRTLAALVRQIARKIDKALMYNGLSVALSVASNSGGTWTAATDPLITLVSYIGVAKVKVQARFYEPTFCLFSATNSDKLGNWDGFTAAGKRPDVDLNANGYVGRVKGLPVFDSTEFSDSFALVGNRELVMYRVYQPMALKGPYPSYSSNKLIASEQWYGEQYDGAVSPVAGKGSTVKMS